MADYLEDCVVDYMLHVEREFPNPSDETLEAAERLARRMLKCGVGFHGNQNYLTRVIARGEARRDAKSRQHNREVR